MTTGDAAALPHQDVSWLTVITRRRGVKGLGIAAMRSLPRDSGHVDRRTASANDGSQRPQE